MQVQDARRKIAPVTMCQATSDVIKEEVRNAASDSAGENGQGFDSS